MKTSRQIIDEINQMNDGSIMEIYKVQGGFKTKFQSGWTPAPEGIEAIIKKEKEKEIMKEYRLKQWYPTLAISWRTDDRYEYDAYRQVMINISNVKNGLAMPKEMFVKKQELHSDFWELIEEQEPLFITDDGVKVFDKDAVVYIVRNNTFAKIGVCAAYLNKHDFEHRVFFHESNAVECIWQNKKLFSYEDMMKAKHSIILTSEDIEKSAKERSKK